MVTDFYPPHMGGVEVVVRSLAHELVARGHDVSVATIQTEGLAKREDDGGVRVHRVRCTTGRFPGLFSQRRPWAAPAPDPEAVAGLRRVMACEAPQIVHGHDWLARSFIPLKPKFGSRLVMSLHYFTLTCAKKSLMYGGRPCSGPRFLKCLRCGSSHYGALKGPPIVLGNFAFAAAERRAVDLFLPVSRASEEGNGLRTSGLPRQVIPNFVAAAPPTSRETASLVAQLPQEDYLLFVGDIRREKGIHVLLDAYQRLRVPPHLVMIGKVWPDSPRKLPPKVSLLTDWPNDAVREAMRRCLALVAPSIWPEPFGMVVIEALAEGKPVLASHIGGMAELVEHGVNGFTLPPGDAEVLAEAIQALLEDERLVARFSDSASRSAARFRAELIVPRFEQAYASLLRGHEPEEVSRPRGSV